MTISEQIIETMYTFRDGNLTITQAEEAIHSIIYKAQYKELTDLAKYKSGSHKAWCDHYEERYNYLKSKM